MMSNFYDSYMLVAVLGYAALQATHAQNPPGGVIGETHVLHENTCGPTTCPPGSVEDGSECISELSNITGIVTRAFSQDFSSKMKENIHLDDFHLEAKLTTKMCKILETFNVAYQNLNATVDIKYDSQTFAITNMIHCY